MKLATLATLALATTQTPIPHAFLIGNSLVTIPNPDSFAIVTDDMGAVYRLFEFANDPRNDLIAAYIPASDVPPTPDDDAIKLERYIQLKINKQLRTVVASKDEFAAIKAAMKQATHDMAESLPDRVTDILEDTRDGFQEDFDLDLAISLSDVIPLEPHHEADDSFAHSMYLNFNLPNEREDSNSVYAVTSTALNVNGVILSINCYAPQQDLEWTRSASKAWADAIIAANTPSPQTRLPTAPGGILIAAAALVLIVVVAGIVMLSRNGSTSTPSA